MASFLNKWFISSLVPVLFFGNTPYFGNPEFHPPCRQMARYHPFHVSVVEVNHNQAEQTLEISCKIFTDDFEKALAQHYKTRVDLINPPDKAAMDSLVKKYLISRLAISTGGKTLKLSYIGFERENEAVYGYVQADHVEAVKTIIITTNLLYDLFTDQVNLVHVIVGGKRKSTKLDYPETAAKFEF